jgi:hypothetical protein
VVFVSLRRFSIVVTAVCCVAVSFSSFCIFISPFSMRCFVLVLHFLLLLSVVRSLPFALRKIPAPDGRHPPCTRRLLVPAGPVRRLPPTRKRCGRSSVALVRLEAFTVLFECTYILVASISDLLPIAARPYPTRCRIVSI